MDGQFDLFEMRTGAFPRWVDAVADLEQAMNRLENLAQARLGVEYFVRDFCSGSVVAFARRPSNRKVGRTTQRLGSSLSGSRTEREVGRRAGRLDVSAASQ